MITVTAINQNLESIPLPTAFPDVNPSEIQRLDLSFNQISSLSGLQNFPNVEELILDNNCIAGVGLLEQYKCVTLLSLNNNNVSDIEGLLATLERLLPSLIYLSCLGNPCCPDQLTDAEQTEDDYRRYRYYIVYRLPKLRFLDSRAVLDKERREAQRHGPFLKRVRIVSAADSSTDGVEETISANPFPTTSAESAAYRPCKYVYRGIHSEGNRMNPNNLKDLAGRLARGSKGLAAGVGLLAAAGGLVYGINQSMYTVEGGHRAVIFSRIGGVQNYVLAEGLHFRIPWFQYPVIYDIRSKPRKIASPTGSKDMQMVNIGLRVLCRPDAQRLPNMLRQLGTDYDERVLPSIVNEVLKSVVAKFNAAQLITQRQQVSLLIRKELIDRARDFNIIVDDVSITELSFSTEYTQAVESKQVAQQEAQRAQFVVEKAKQERQQKIVQAEGEAAAAKLIGLAVSQNPGYLKLRKLHAAQKIAQTISNTNGRAFLNASSLMLSVTGDAFDDRIDASIKKKH